MNADFFSNGKKIPSRASRDSVAFAVVGRTSTPLPGSIYMNRIPIISSEALFYRMAQNAACSNTMAFLTLPRQRLFDVLL